MNSIVDSYLKEAIDQWLDMGVDGVRVDAVKHMPAGWQKNWLSSIYEDHSVFVFGEWYNGGTDNDEDMTYFANNSGMSLLDFRFANAVRNSVGLESSTMEKLYQVIVDTQNDYDEVNDQVIFIDNHDMSRFMTLCGENRSAVNQAYVLLLTSRGIPTIYYGSKQYMTGSSDPYNRSDMTGFDTSTTAYQIISALAPLRKTNAALAYGDTVERWLNDDVLIYERQFGDDVVLTAVNRNENCSYRISGLYTNLPSGSYEDVLENIMNGNSITVNSSGAVDTFSLNAGACAVWAYTADEHHANVGNVDPGMGIVGNIISISGRGFGSSAGTVTFGDTVASVTEWTDSLIQVLVPDITAGNYEITVTNLSGESSSFSSFSVLTGSQIPTRFIVNNAETDYGTNIYLVGNIQELGNWDPDHAIGPFFNETESIASYPSWFYDVSLPASTNIEYKFIKKDSSGNVVWESGTNHTLTTVGSGTATEEVNWQD
jgi:hypothetical protein